MMSELLKLAVIRPSEALSGEQIARIGYHTHPTNRRSGRFLEWLELCTSESEENQVNLQNSMEEFLKSKSSLFRIADIAAGPRAIVELALQKGAHITLQDIEGAIPKKSKEEKGLNGFKETIMALEDRLLAMTQLDDPAKPEYDLQQALHVLDLALIVHTSSKESLSINMVNHFRRPIVLPGCFKISDPCRLFLHDAQINSGTPTSPNSGDGQEPCKCEEAPSNDPCDCKCNDECVKQDKCCATIVPYIGELLVVKDEVTCYEPGEISYIENVIKGETRERTHRHLQSREVNTELTENITSIDERNHQVEDWSALQSAVETVMDAGLSLEASNSNSVGFAEGPFYFSASTSLTASVSRKETRKITRDQSRLVIEKALKRVEKQVKSVAKERLYSEMEETNRHSFVGNEDMSRQFTYVNQVRKGQMFSYGYRMMLDFYLPEPAELYKTLLEKEFGRKRPVKPCIDLEDIKPEDFELYFACYGFTDLERPRESGEGRWMEVEAKEEKPAKSGKTWSISYPVSIPAGFTGTKMKFVNPVIHRQNFTFAPHSVTFSLGGKNLIDTWNSPDGALPDEHGPKTGLSLTGNNMATITAHKLKSYNLHIYIWLEPDPVDNSIWQRDVLRRLIEKYEADLADYEAAYAKFEQEKMERFARNPRSLSQTVQEQLKHAAISYITCQFFDENNALYRKVEPCGFPQMNLRETEREGKMVRFFEQAIEWDFMNYMLYPYFWGAKCTWEQKLGQDAPDDLFTKFLQSGFARVTLAIRPGFENFINYYLATGRIWGSTGIPPIIGAGSVPIYQEIRESKENFNADRDGHVICDTALGFLPNQIVLRDNLDYFVTVPAPPVFDPLLADVDIHREIVIDCEVYKIMTIHQDSLTGEIVLTLDRDFEGEKDIEYPWATGALFIGAPWAFRVPTSLVWLREETRCLPCYPIDCNENP